jgi:hypothetical protein
MAIVRGACDSLRARVRSSVATLGRERERYERVALRAQGVLDAMVWLLEHSGQKCSKGLLRILLLFLLVNVLSYCVVIS